MMRLPDLEAWAVFAKVAEMGSFNRAAQELDLARATVSKMISRLEERMDTVLFHRTTRKLSLTESGRRALGRATLILAESTAIEADIMEEAVLPRGTIRLACTSGFGVQSLAAALPDFMIAYPDILIDLCMNDHNVDVVAEGFDLAIRIGQGEDSSLKTSRLFSYRRPLVAAPSLIERLGTPKRPEDLARYPAIVPTHVPWGDDWGFTNLRGEVVVVRARSVLRVNNAAAMIPAAVAGLGITLLPEFFIWQQLREGSLIELLNDWTAPAAPIHLVTPPGTARPARVRLLIEFLRKHFAAQAGAAGVER